MINTNEVEIRTEGGPEITGAKAADVVRSGGWVKIVADGGFEVTVRNASTTLASLPGNDAQVSWPSYGPVDSAGVSAFGHAIWVASEIADRVRAIDHPFAEIPGWVKIAIGGDYSVELLVYYASKAYHTGIYTHHGSWYEAIRRIKEGGCQVKTYKPNEADHRFSTGAMVEYGTSSPHGGDRLGEVRNEAREYGRDGYLIQPLSVSPGDGTLPSVYPAHMVQPWKPERWTWDRKAGPYGSYVRTYAEIRKPTIGVQIDCHACGGEGWLPSLPEGESTCTADGCKNGKITVQKPARRAIIRTICLTAGERAVISRYLPANYKVISSGGIPNGEGSYLIEGYDNAGWTLDGYVIPRLASGLIRAEEVSA